MDPNARSGEPCFLTDLPPEVVQHIVEVTDPSADFDLAVTCKYLKECSRDVLDRHRRCHNQITFSDIDPATVPNLLRAVILDPVAGYHVRAFEVWGSRVDWSDWKHHKLYKPAAGLPFELMEHPSLTEEYGSGYFDKGELDGFIELMCSVLRVEAGELGVLRRGLEMGNDGALKALLFSLCRLKSLIFIKYDNRTDDHNELMADGCLSLISTAISRVFKSDQKWPQGLLNLTEIAVGVGTLALPDQTDYVNYDDLICPLLLLPGINSLYVNCLQGMDTNGALLPKGSSTLRHLFLDYFSEGDSPKVDYDLLDILLAAPKALETLALDDAEINRVNRVFSAAENQAKSLEALMIYGSIIKGSKNSFMYSTKALQPFTNLKTIILDVMDLLAEASSRQGWDLTTEYLPHSNLSFDDQVGRYLECALPSTLEVLILKCQKHLTEIDADVVNDAVTTFIQSGRCPNLQAIFLDDLEQSSASMVRHESPSIAERTKLWFQEAIEAGLEHNVYVHTRSRLAPRRREFKMPLSYIDRDLKTSPYVGYPLRQRRGTSALRPVFGIRTWVGCDNCGACDYCHKFYDEEVWVQAKPVPKSQTGLNIWARSSDSRGLVMPMR